MLTNKDGVLASVGKEVLRDVDGVVLNIVNKECVVDVNFLDGLDRYSTRDAT